MTETQYRRIAQGFDGVVEGSHMAHPDFRVGGRIFATLHGNNKTGAVMLTPEHQMAKGPAKSHTKTTKKTTSRGLRVSTKKKTTKSRR
jgi:hypothetical protein